MSRRAPLWEAEAVLVLDRGEDWIAIPQPAHAWLAAEVARAWGEGPVPRPEPFAEVCLGVEQHDVAWAAWDLRPPLHAPAGRAASFLEAAFRPRLEIWWEAPRAVLAQSPWAALLVSLHGTNIHTRFVDADRLPPADGDLVRAYLTEQRALQDGLIRALGTTREAAEEAGDFVFCLDSISLGVCHGWGAMDLPPVRGTTIRLEPLEEREFTLDPWPLAPERLEVGVHAKRLTERMDDEGSLHAALDAAPWERLRWTLRRE